MEQKTNFGISETLKEWRTIQPLKQDDVNCISIKELFTIEATYG